MHPFLGYIPLYFVMWLCAATVAVALGTAIAASGRFPVARSVVALVMLAVAILCGSRLLYLAEARFFPFDDYVPAELRGALHGFRIPGGILLLAVARHRLSAALSVCHGASSATA
jgi:hypothetical protein